MTCDHYDPDTHVCGNGECRFAGRRVALSICGWCPDYAGPARGAGDVVHKVLHAPVIGAVTRALAGENCETCEQRRKRLNALVSFTNT